MKYVGRKLYHSLGGLGLLSLYHILGRDRALLFYAALFIIVLAADLARLRIPSFNRLMFERFGGFIRKNEANRLTGTPPYLLGIGLSFFLYSPAIATAAICFLAFGDVAATTIGERFGRTKIGDKSLEGSAAFVFAAMIAGFALYFSGMDIRPEVIVIGALIAAAVELLSLPVNDNLLIPLASGGSMELFARWFG